ncbi:MAG: D-glycero-D-manno-heptose 1-phosphate guanosyltransferase [Bacteroidota bacterium]|nr:D-glycero-D-manno-heptose 1-phosphate guanosyltransferase [Bacteroidota bacterium]
MAPINGKPFLHYIFQSLQKQEIKNAILSVGHLKEVVQDYFKDNYVGIEIKYAVEQEALGTGGGIKNAFQFVDDDAYVLNGDTFFDIQLSSLKNNDADITVALKPMQHFDRYGTVEINKGRITAFHEKKKRDEGLINGGIYYFRKSLFDKISTANKFSFEKEVLEKYVGELEITGKIFDNYFIDIGIPEDYQRAQNDLA